MSRKFSFWVLLGAIALVGAMFYRVMSSFLLPLFLAMFFTVVFSPVYNWLLDKCRQRRHLAAGLATTVVVLVVFLPSVFVIVFAGTESFSLARRFDVRTVVRKIDKIRAQLGLAIPFADEVHGIDDELRGLSLSLLSEPLAVTVPPATEESDSSLLPAVDSSSPTATDGASDSDVTRKRQEAVRSLIARVADLRARMIAANTANRIENSDAPHKYPAALVEKIDRMAEFLKSAGSASPEAVEDFIHDAVFQWEDFKLALLGGPTWARFKELANPGPDEFRAMTKQLVAELQTWLLPVAKGTSSFAARLIFGSVIMLVAVFFFFADGNAMIATVVRLVPLEVSHQAELLADFGAISRAVVSATLTSAVVQGALSGLGFWVAGVDSVFLLMLLATVFAMIPFVGAAAVWIPVSLWLFAVEERTLAAVLLAIYGAAIVSQADNVVKPLLLRGRSNLHPLLALLSILGGVQALGPVGIVVGPMLVVFLQTLLNILHRELLMHDEGTKRNLRLAVNAQKHASPRVKPKSPQPPRLRRSR